MNLEDVKAIFESSMEDNTIPVKIVQGLEKFDGKNLTNRVINHLVDTCPELRDINLRIVKKFSWTEIAWDSDNSLTVAYQTKNVAISCVYILGHNARYFSALDERNKKRLEILSDEAKLQKLLNVIQNYMKAKTEFGEFITHENFGTSIYKIREVADFKD